MTTTTTIRSNLNALGVSDIYSLMLFILYKLTDIPEYATTSELCTLLDSRGLTRLFTYFEGRTITIPTKEEFQIITDALLLYQKVNIDGKSFADALADFPLSAKNKKLLTDVYVKIISIVSNYNINRAGLKKDDR